MKHEASKPTCVFCGRSNGVQFAIFNPRFQPFGTACTECEETLPEGTTVPEKKPEPAKAGKWSACPTNPPGPIQVNKFNKAHNAISAEHNTHTEKWGVIGGEEHESSFLVIYGGGRRDDVTAAQTQIGEKYGWTVTKANVNQVIADFAAAMPALKAGRPVKDKRVTKEQDEARNAEIAAAKAEREALDAALAATHPAFQAKIKRLERVTNKAASFIYSLWREYSAQCHDQSALLSEFVRQYQPKLQRPVALLEEAIADQTALGTVAHNRTHNGVEIAFTDKPSDDLRYQLKRAGFRITRRPPWRWYAKFSAHAWAKACELAGVVDACPVEASGADPAGGYVQAQEDAYSDQQCAAIGA